MSRSTRTVLLQIHRGRRKAGLLIVSCCSESGELLGQGRVRIEGGPRLSLAPSCGPFRYRTGGGGGGRQLEAEHRSYALDPIVEVLALADLNCLQPTPGAILQATCHVAVGAIEIGPRQGNQTPERSTDNVPTSAVVAEPPLSGMKGSKLSWTLHAHRRTWLPIS